MKDEKEDIYISSSDQGGQGRGGEHSVLVTGMS